jgi:hypothetical protein
MEICTTKRSIINGRRNKSIIVGRHVMQTSSRFCGVANSANLVLYTLMKIICKFLHISRFYAFSISALNGIRSSRNLSVLLDSVNNSALQFKCATKAVSYSFVTCMHDFPIDYNFSAQLKSN